MADIFISYKREDRQRIAPLARALEGRGYTVWWDLELVPSQKFERQIKQELDLAKCVIVVWTERLVGQDGMYLSEWVQTEANAGDARGVLLPVQFDAGRVHWRHGQNQYAALNGWSGDEDAVGFLDLLKGVELHAGARMRPQDQELASWQAAEREETAAAFRRFLAAHASSRFADIARGRVLELEEWAAWAALGAAPSAAALSDFLSRFPGGRFAETAEVKRREADVRAASRHAALAPPAPSAPPKAGAPNDVRVARALAAPLATRRRLLWAGGASGLAVVTFGLVNAIGSRQFSSKSAARVAGAQNPDVTLPPVAPSETAADGASTARPPAMAPSRAGLGAPQALLIWRKQSLRHRLGLNSIAFSPDSARCVTSCGDDSLYLWEVASGRLIRKFEGHANDANAAAFSPDGTFIVSTSTDRTVRLWMVETGALVRTIAGMDGRGGMASFSPDGRRIVAASWDGRVRIWSLDGTLERTVTFGGLGFTARFSPDGARIVATGKQNDALVFDARTGEALFSLVGHAGQLADAEYSPDGARIATASTDGTARVWNASDGRLIVTLGDVAGGGAGVWVNQASFSGDGALLATAHRETGADKGAIRIWDVATGRLITRFGQSAEMVSGVVFSHDSARLASASWDGLGSIWAVEGG